LSELRVPSVDVDPQPVDTFVGCRDMPVAEIQAEQIGVGTAVQREWVMLRATTAAARG
jgi:hypothetical protein